MLLDPAYKSADEATPFKLFGTKKKPVKIIIYGWDKTVLLDSDARRYIHLLKLPISQTLVIMSTGKIPYVDVRLEYLDVFTWALLSKRSGHIKHFPFCFRMGVGEDDGAAPLHAWCNLNHAGRMSLTPHDIPFNLERMVLEASGVTIIINTQKLENNWLQATCHTGRFDISVQHARYWDKLMKIPFAKQYFEISEVTGQGAVSSHAASLGKMAYAEALGPFPLDIINLPGRTADASLLRVLEDHDIEWQGTKTRVNGYRCTITIGFADPETQIKAAKLFSRKKINGINRNQPLRIAVVWDVPQGYCRNCYNPDNAASFSQGHSRGGKNKKRCPNMDNICPICKSTDHAIINCPFEETKLIAVKKENVMYEAPTLSAAALAGRAPGEGQGQIRESCFRPILWVPLPQSASGLQRFLL